MKSIAKVLSPILIIALLLSAVAVLAPTGANSVQAAAPIFTDDMESGTGDWTADGFWHQITGAETISVLNVGGAVPNIPPDDINPDLVTLPDTDAYGQAFLPHAFSGSTSWWYGVDANGTFIDSTFNLAGQSAKHGGDSSVPNSGSLTSPVIDLTGQTTATLEFMTWWEVEGVDANAFDLMRVQASTNGTNWDDLGNLNPLSDVNNLAEQNYSSGGSNATPVWVHNVFDLSEYKGGTVQVRFYFNTGDSLYNGFRGWFVDDVKVTADAVPAPVITSIDPQHLGDPSIIVKIFGENFANGASVKIGDYPVADAAVISSSEIHVLVNNSMPFGTYSVTVTNPDLKSDSFSSIFYEAAAGVAADFSDTPVSGDAPLTVQFTDLSTGTITKWLWDFGDGFTSTQQNPSHIYATLGTYNVSLTVTGPGDPGTDTMLKNGYVTVTEAAALLADFVGEPTVGDAPLMVKFQDRSKGSISGWLWDFGDETTSDLQNPSHKYATPGVYDVSLTVTGSGDPGTDTESKTEYIKVNNPAPPVDPAVVEATLYPGESIEVEKKITMPVGTGETTYTVKPVVDAEPFVVTYEPAIHENVAANSTVTFVETIAAPEDMAPGLYHFTVQFLANDALIGTQEVSIVVPGVAPAVVDEVMHSGETLWLDKSVFVPVGKEQTVKPVVVGAAPLLVNFYPLTYENVEGGSLLSFEENITVPWSTLEGEYSFTVEFYVDEVLIDVQTVNITVELYPWTMLLYMAGDNYNSGQAWHVLQSIESVPFDMNPVLVLLDGSDHGDSQILRKSYEGMVPMDDEGTVILKNSEVNMGDPETLKNFINWGRSHGHAENYILVLWDEGAGWRTSRFLKDMNSNGDDISLSELGDALAGATDGGLDPLQVVAFDASLMQMLEVDSQIAPYAWYAVGSEEILPHGSYGSILSNVSTNPDLTPAELAVMITEEFSDVWAGPEPQFPVGTLSAIDLSKIAALADATDAFATELISSIGKYDAEIAKARAMTEDFGQMLQQSPGSIDLYHFAQLIAQGLPDTSVAIAAAAVMDAVGGVDGAVIASVAGPGHPNANGIAIYYPDIEIQWGSDQGIDDIPAGPVLQTMVYEPAYDRDVDFAGDTLWNEYLKQAPRLIDKGLLAFYIPDVLILADVYTDPIIRLEWPKTTEGSLAVGFTLTKPVDIIVTPEGAIDIGVVALLFSQADLDKADILNTELIGVARSDAEAWSLEKLTMNVPTWLFDVAGILGGINGIMSDVSDQVYPISEEPADPVMGILGALEGLGGIILGNGHDSANYAGAVVAVPWLDLSNIAPQVYDMIPNFPAVSSDVTTSLAMIATDQEDYLTPIQYPQNLDKGWNLISLPVIPLDNNIGTILSGHKGLVEGVTDNVEVIWSYDAATGEWQAYSPAAPLASDLKELHDGAGYWVKMKEDATLTVIGSNFLAGPHAPPEYDLVEGWNLLGYKGILPMAPKGEWYYNEYWDDWYEDYNYDSAYIGGYLEEDKITYNRLQGYNRVFDSLYTPDFLYPNDGYWIYVSEAGSIPGLNDENWVNAMEFGANEWLGEAVSWAGFWLMHDGDLGLRLAWNGLWYAGWVIAPSEINYGGGLGSGFIPGLPIP